MTRRYADTDALRIEYARSTLREMAVRRGISWQAVRAQLRRRRIPLRRPGGGPRVAGQRLPMPAGDFRTHRGIVSDYGGIVMLICGTAFVQPCAVTAGRATRCPRCGLAITLARTAHGPYLVSRP